MNEQPPRRARRYTRSQQEHTFALMVACGIDVTVGVADTRPVHLPGRATAADVRRAVRCLRDEGEFARPVSAVMPRAHVGARRVQRRAGASSRTSSADPPDDDEHESPALPSAPAHGRRCAFCRGDISHLRADARTCGARCRKDLAEGRTAPGAALNLPPGRAYRLAASELLLIPITPEQSRALRARMDVRVCVPHKVLHPDNGQCPECAEAIRALMSHPVPIVHRQHRPWEIRRRRQRAPVRRAWAETARVWDELPPLTADQRALIHEAPLEDLLASLRGRIKGLQYGLELITEREAVTA